MNKESKNQTKATTKVCFSLPRLSATTVTYSALDHIVSRAFSTTIKVENEADEVILSVPTCGLRQPIPGVEKFAEFKRCHHDTTEHKKASIYTSAYRTLTLTLANWLRSDHHCDISSSMSHSLPSNLFQPSNSSSGHSQLTVTRQHGIRSSTSSARASRNVLLT